MGYLGLIGRIGGVPSRILQHIAFHHVGNDAVVVSEPDIGAVELVLGAHLADMGSKFGLGHGLGQVEVLLQADGRGNRLGDQFLDAGHPDGGDHTVNILLAWAYVAVNESVLLHHDGLGKEARINPSAEPQRLRRGYTQGDILDALIELRQDERATWSN